VKRIPAFRKPDRYKASSYRAYNFRMPERYDSAYFVTLCQLPLWHHRIAAELKPHLASSSILDVGCATGRLLAGLGRAGATRLSGVDLAPNILAVARERLDAERVRADLRAADVEDSIPWPDEAFDFVTLTGVLHHFYRPRDALRQIYRVLRPGAAVLLVDPCFFTPVRQVFNLYLRIAPHDGDCRFYSPRAAIELLESERFRCSRPERVGLWAYFIAATRPTARGQAGSARRGPDTV
jgi:ubiquinone/menaquinone biosynthesis C-methylase UbiE